jgi:hypothetical protein
VTKILFCSSSLCYQKNIASFLFSSNLAFILTIQIIESSSCQIMDMYAGFFKQQEGLVTSIDYNINIKNMIQKLFTGNKLQNRL